MTKNLLPLLLIASFIAGCFAWNMAYPEPILAAALPQSVAVFETSLAAPVSSSATTMTLTANSIRGGGSLSGYNCFTVDEGSAQAETICGTISGTTVSNLSRGISQSTGTTTVAALQFSHRRGANVKITDFPVIQILKAQNNGEDTFVNPLSYASHLTFSSTTQIVDKKYVDDTAFSGAGVIDATAAARGVVELSTALEAASTTAQGSSGVLVLPASMATDTPAVGCALGYSAIAGAGCSVIANLKGKLNHLWLDLTEAFTFTGGVTISGTATTTISTPTSGLDWQLVAQATSTNPGGNLLQATTTTGAAFKHYRIELNSNSLSGNDTYGLVFNNDYSFSTYNFTVGEIVPSSNHSATQSYLASTSPAGSASPTGISLSKTGTTTPASFVVDLYNYPGTQKSLTWSGMTGSVAAGATRQSGSGVWNNTAQVTNFEFTTGHLATGSFNSTTTMTVWGSNR